MTSAHIYTNIYRHVYLIHRCYLSLAVLGEVARALRACQGSSAARYLQPSCNLFSPLVTIKLSLLFRYHSRLHISVLAPVVPLLLFLALFAKTFLGKCVFPLINHVIRMWLFWLFPCSDSFGCFVCTLALS